jgi:D-alanine-D-alanine ligase
MDLTSLLHRNGLDKSKILVWALIPFREDGFFDDYYDWHKTQDELEKAFSELGIAWHWQPTTINTVKEIIGNIKINSNSRFPIVFNYCDGDEINGFPGLSVVKSLEKEGLAFTGADALSYEISTSKIWMKRCFDERSVPTAPWAVIKEDADITTIFEKLGPPLFVKPSISAGAWGLTLKSVVNSSQELRTQVERLHGGLHGFNFKDGGIFAERFIVGPEYTVFLVGSDGFEAEKRIYPPLRRFFHPSLSAEESFVTYERNWNKYNEEIPLANNELIFSEKLAEPEVIEMLSELAWNAHCAINGKGYSRVDIRVDENTGRPYVLEVNANCSLSSGADDTSTGYILNYINQPYSVLVDEILSDGLRRFLNSNNLIQILQNKSIKANNSPL